MTSLLKSSAQKVLLAAVGTPGESLRGIVKHARERDWHLMTDPTLSSTLPRGRTADGVLAALPLPLEWLAEIERSGVPCVTLGGEARGDRWPHVESDQSEIGRMAADHLLARAHRSFAWAPFAQSPANAACLAAFEERLVEHGCTCHQLPAMHADSAAAAPDDWADYRQRLLAQLARLPRPTAIFAFNDCTAAEIVDVCRDAGFAIPQEFAVLGVGDSITCTSSPIPLSSIDLDLEAIGRRAAETLGDLMNGGAVPSAPIRVRPRAVITRVSTDVVAVSDPRVARALSYIAENFPDPMLNVGRVAQAIGMSRRTLERSFREETGCSINEQIVSARMREASRMLQQHQRARSADVATLVGLPGGRTFFRTFRRYFGMSPRAHRDWAIRASSASRVAGAESPALVTAATAPRAPLARSRPTAA